MKVLLKSTLMKGIFLTLFLCFIFTSVNGQPEQQNPLPQFIFPVFAKSLVKMKDGRQMAASLNYNMVDEEMIFEQKGVYMALDKPQEVDTIFLQNRKFIPVEKAFYEVLNTGKTAILIQHRSRYTPVGTETAYGIKSVTLGPTAVRTGQSGNQVRILEVPPDVTVSPALVYWVMKNNEMNKFNSEKQFLKLFPGNEDKLKEFIKSNRIDIKSREDLIKLGNFCNELEK